MAKPIVTVPNEVLTLPAKTITVFDKKLKKLVAEMETTLLATKNPKGVGLAGPQVGESLRIFLTKPAKKDPVRVFINPEIIGYSDTASPKADPEDKPLEGCLSIPNIWGNVDRPTALTLKYQDIEGSVHEEIIDGFLAVIVQHETDHTNGILFTQRVIEQQGKFYKIVEDRDGKDVLEEVKL